MEQNPVTEWVEVAEVYNQDEAQLISGLLSMAGIPVKVERESAGDIYGLTIGPLAKSQILVPSDKVTDAAKILAGNIEDFEEPVE
jgi:hypothetical protein